MGWARTLLAALDEELGRLAPELDDAEARLQEEEGIGEVAHSNASLVRAGNALLLWGWTLKTENLKLKTRLQEQHGIGADLTACASTSHPSILHRAPLPLPCHRSVVTRLQPRLWLPQPVRVPAGSGFRV